MTQSKSPTKVTSIRVWRSPVWESLDSRVDSSHLSTKEFSTQKWSRTTSNLPLMSKNPTRLPKGSRKCIKGLEGSRRPQSRRNKLIKMRTKMRKRKYKRSLNQSQSLKRSRKIKTKMKMMISLELLKRKMISTNPPTNRDTKWAWNFYSRRGEEGRRSKHRSRKLYKDRRISGIRHFLPKTQSNRKW